MMDQDSAKTAGLVTALLDRLAPAWEQLEAALPPAKELANHFQTEIDPDDPDLVGRLAGAERIVGLLAKIQNTTEAVKLQFFGPIIHRLVKSLAKDRRDENDHGIKLSNVAILNKTLRASGPYCVAHPETGHPCLLFVVGSPDGSGRYVLEDRLTKKRSHTSKSLMDLIPMTIQFDQSHRSTSIIKKVRPVKRDDGSILIPTGGGRAGLTGLETFQTSIFVEKEGTDVTLTNAADSNRGASKPKKRGKQKP